MTKGANYQRDRRRNNPAYRKKVNDSNRAATYRKEQVRSGKWIQFWVFYRTNWSPPVALDKISYHGKVYQLTHVSPRMYNKTCSDGTRGRFWKVWAEADILDEEPTTPHKGRKPVLCQS